MNFTDWQLWRLRCRLNAYRIRERKNGSTPSWEAVRDAILFSRSTYAEHPERGKPKFKSEALRRFAEGTNKAMTIDRLNDVKRFLIDEHLLTEEQLADSGTVIRESLEVQALIGTDRPVNTQFFKSPPKALIAKNSPLRYEVLIGPRINNSSFQAEERVIYDGVHRDHNFDFYQKGYIFALACSGRLNAYFRPPNLSEMVQYLELPVDNRTAETEILINLFTNGHPELAPKSSTVYLLRIPPPVAPVDGLQTKAHLEDMVLRFRPQVDPSRSAAREAA